ncbi:MAG: dTDP-4-dehydrorhamnose 3,5-epimerase [Actinomycetota bacterium]
MTVLDEVLLFELTLHPDERGHFREVYHAERMGPMGLDGFVPVQQNVSANVRGALRGIHAEPWNKFIHVQHGEAFSVIVDLRPESTTFGAHQAFTLTPEVALYVPKGFGNSFQAVSDTAVYSYLVDAHWQAGLVYPAVAFDDPDLAIEWPITDGEMIVSDKDRKNPSLRECAASLGITL